MQIKELIDIINIYDIKVIFDNAEDVAEKIMKGTSPLYFNPVEGSERKNIKRKKITVILLVQQQQYILLIYQ